MKMVIGLHCAAHCLQAVDEVGVGGKLSGGEHDVDDLWGMD